MTYLHRYQRGNAFADVSSRRADCKLNVRKLLLRALLTPVEVVVQDVQRGIDPDEEGLMRQYIVRGTKADVSLHVRWKQLQRGLYDEEIRGIRFQSHKELRWTKRPLL